jgi:HD-GYP domain-containing protein (c-di-GMP phosphodiesterase class II)
MAKQDISIRHLKSGMFVVGIDVSWLDSPFLRHSFKIGSQGDIDKLVKAGVNIVTIERDKSDVLPPDSALDSGPELEPVLEALAEPVLEIDAATQQSELADKLVPTSAPTSASIGEAETASETKPENAAPATIAATITTAPASMTKELGAARKLHSDVNKLCGEVFDSLSSGKAVDVECVKDLVEQTVESLTRNNQALFSFLHMQRKDEGLYEHAFSVFSLVLALASSLGLDKKDQELLGFAALVHDVGWLKLPLHLFGKGKAYSAAERTLISKHPLLAARMIEGGEGVTDRLKSLVAFHHEFMDGTGYPTGRKIENDMLWSVLVVADRYDELVHQLLDRSGMIPKSALRELFIDAQKGRIDVKVVQCLITLLGVYPISSAVQLKNGEKAVVIECFREAPAQPRIRIFYDPKGALKPKSEDIDLRELAEDDLHQILKAVDWRVPGVDPAHILNIESLRVA